MTDNVSDVLDPQLFRDLDATASTLLYELDRLDQRVNELGDLELHRRWGAYRKALGDFNDAESACQEALAGHAQRLEEKLRKTGGQ